MIRILLLFAVGVTVVFAQSKPAFEVASVRPSPRTAGSCVGFLPGGRISASSWLKQLIQIGYGLEDFQVFGGPDWLISSQWYEIEAKAADPNRDAPIPSFRGP